MPYNILYASLAQLDRVTGFEPVGREFKSLVTHQKRTKTKLTNIKG